MDSTGYVNSQTGIFIYIHLVIIGYGCVLPWICHIYSSTWTLRSCQPWKSSTVDSYFSIIYIHIHTVYNTFYGFLSLLPLFLSSLDNVDHNALENKLRTLRTSSHPSLHMYATHLTTIQSDRKTSRPCTPNHIRNDHENENKEEWEYPYHNTPDFLDPIAMLYPYVAECQKNECASHNCKIGYCATAYSTSQETLSSSSSSWSLSSWSSLSCPLSLSLSCPSRECRGQCQDREGPSSHRRSKMRSRLRQLLRRQKAQ